MDKKHIEITREKLEGLSTEEIMKKYDLTMNQVYSRIKTTLMNIAFVKPTEILSLMDDFTMADHRKSLEVNRTKIRKQILLKVLNGVGYKEIGQELDLSLSYCRNEVTTLVEEWNEKYNLGINTAYRKTHLFERRDELLKLISTA